MKIIAYDRAAVVEYARKWAFARNPRYFDFSSIGGDCTNFASQCLFAGCGQMNFTPTFGWFYRSANDRTPSWTGVEYFYRFLMDNAGIDGRVVGNGLGPFAEQTAVENLQIGDFVQFGRGTDDLYHTPVVVGFQGGVPLLAAHSYDAYNRPLNTWNYQKIRCLHILGARVEN